MSVDALTVELKDEYCISLTLRDYQVRQNVKRYPNRIKPYLGVREDPIALVCFGPSLNQTWEKVKDFKYIVSCSGSHKFLMDRDILPTWHVEVDPRDHKVALIGDKVHWQTEYLMASCCHPSVLKHLKNHNAKITLWHVYTNGFKYPPGEWTIMGGSNVGLRALTLARFLGFVNVHIFGMDGSFPNEQNIHASTHPKPHDEKMVISYMGKDYLTTPSILKCARRTFKDLEILADVDATFYGDGLVQDMAKTLPINRIKQSGIAFLTSKTPGIVRPNDGIEKFKEKYSDAYMVRKESHLVNT